MRKSKKYAFVAGAVSIAMTAALMIAPTQTVVTADNANGSQTQDASVSEFKFKYPKEHSFAEINQFYTEHQYDLSLPDKYDVQPDISNEEINNRVGTDVHAIYVNDAQKKADRDKLAGKLSQETVDNALNALNYVRYTSGLQQLYIHTNDQIGGFQWRAQAGAALLAELNTITHNVDGNDALAAGVVNGVFGWAKAGPAGSNLVAGYGVANKMVNSFMPDIGNDRTGLSNRSYILNPGLSGTGIGAANLSGTTNNKTGKPRGSAVTMMVTYYGADPDGLTAVLWPARKQPIETFQARGTWQMAYPQGNPYQGNPWSYFVNTDSAKVDTSTLKVTLECDGKPTDVLDFNNLTATEKAENRLFTIASNPLKRLIGFRPHVAYDAGDKVKVTIEGIVDAQNAPIPVSYDVHFFKTGTEPHPNLEQKSVNRTGENVADVQFTADYSGTMRYLVLDADQPEPSANEVINGKEFVISAGESKLDLMDPTGKGAKKLYYVTASTTTGDKDYDTAVKSGEMSRVQSVDIGEYNDSSSGGSDTNVNDVAAIGQTNYQTLQDAVNAANDGDTITVLKDINNASNITINGKKLRIDLNGKTLTQNDIPIPAGSERLSGNVLGVSGGGELTISNGDIKCKSDTVFDLSDDSSLNILSGNYTNEKWFIVSDLWPSHGKNLVIGEENGNSIPTFKFTSEFCDGNYQIIKVYNGKFEATNPNGRGLFFSDSPVEIFNGEFNFNWSLIFDKKAMDTWNFDMPSSKYAVIHNGKFTAKPGSAEDGMYDISCQNGNSYGVLLGGEYNVDVSSHLRLLEISQENWKSGTEVDKFNFGFPQANTFSLVQLGNGYFKIIKPGDTVSVSKSTVAMNSSIMKNINGLNVYKNMLTREGYARFDQAEKNLTTDELTILNDSLNKNNKQLLDHIAFDLTLKADIEGQGEQTVTELLNPSQLDMYLDDATLNKVRTFKNLKVARFHNGSVDLLDATLNNNILSFTTDRFSTYAIVDLKDFEVAAEPTANQGLKYTGAEQIGVEEKEGYTLTDNKATAVGNYIATATLKPGYKWPDGTTADKTIPWSIAKGEQGAPENITAVPPTTLNGTDGKITGVDDTMEYRKEGEIYFKPITGTVIENLAPGKYEIRKKGTENFEPGEIVTVEVLDSNLIKTIPPTADKDANKPKTGDNSFVSLWIWLLIASGGTVTALSVYGIKRKVKRNK